MYNKGKRYIGEIVEADKGSFYIKMQVVSIEDNKFTGEVLEYIDIPGAGMKNLFIVGEIEPRWLCHHFTTCDQSTELYEELMDSINRLEKCLKKET